MRDKEFDKYLEGNSELSRLYRDAAQLRPSPEVDDAILAEARRALKPRAQAISSPFASNWTVPLSLAAILVLSVGVVLFVTDESGVNKPTESGADLSIMEKPVGKKSIGADKQYQPRKRKAAPAGKFDLKDGRAQQLKQQPVSASGTLKSRSIADTESVSPALNKAAETKPASKKSVGGSDAQYRRARQTKEERSNTTSQGVASDIAPAVPEKKLKKQDEALLEKIRKLRKAARHKEADKYLEVFRKRYPEYPLDKTITR
ncbi:MAG TPA: hypothetical protein ENG78_06760 [Acidiferrobacteraceae bacterium]|jgi:hypothetical protein|nr:hypothetical protein [Acidiferrobacteraceae bacterium]HEX20500.1 hypothetical protein [Acidiferrobacteraceae bacterium]